MAFVSSASLVVLVGSPHPASSLSLFKLSQVLSVIGLRPSSPGLHRVHMRSYPILPTVALIRDSPAWPRPGDSHRPWRRDRKALHLPRCAIHGQWIPSPLPSLCRSSKKEETKRNPLRHGTVRAGRDRRGKARRGKAHKGVVGGEGQAREPGKLPRTRTG